MTARTCLLTALLTLGCLARPLHSSLITNSLVSRAGLTHPFGAKVEMAYLRECTGYKDYARAFYGQMVVNEYNHKLPGNLYNFTSMALLNDDDSIISSTASHTAATDWEVGHAWNALSLEGAGYVDIRKTSPGRVRFQTWNGMPQIYLPLFMADMHSGKAYLLHVFPEPGFLGLSASDTLSWESGFMWTREDTENVLYEVQIDLEKLIRGLCSLENPQYKEAVSFRGQVQTYPSGNPTNLAFEALNSLYLQDYNADTYPMSEEHICDLGPKPLDMDWAQLQDILYREFEWL